jgi:hypothetical protein
MEQSVQSALKVLQLWQLNYLVALEVHEAHLSWVKKQEEVMYLGILWGMKKVEDLPHEIAFQKLVVKVQLRKWDHWMIKASLTMAYWLLDQRRIAIYFFCNQMHCVHQAADMRFHQLKVGVIGWRH